MLLLITGSRNINQRGLAYARRAVARAKELSYEIIIGDASGVDNAVMHCCDELGVTCTVVGAHGRLRRRTPSCNVVVGCGSYLKRDEYMAEQCDFCLAIWNGESRGTKATFDFAEKLGKTAWLKTFRSENTQDAPTSGMTIVSAHWTPQVNVLRVQCACSHRFEHRADRWKVRCPRCGRSASLGDLRDEYVQRRLAG